MSTNSTTMSTTYCEHLRSEQELFSRPMPMIGLYIALASLVCTLAMTADIFHGIRHRKFWFPCKYFTLNAASLTLIAIAMKLPVDLNNPMPRDVDQLSKFSGTCFMCTMLANFMPSLGTMSNTELLSNVIAVVILVITIAVNICIQLYTTVIRGGLEPIHVIVVTFMLSLLVILVSSALTVPESKRILEIKYREMHKGTLMDEESEHTEKSIVDKLMQRVSKYWIMAETGSPQFVMACSPTCSACGAICLFIAFFLIVLVPNTLVEPGAEEPDPVHGESDYTWSIIPILVIQSIGVIVGTIAPVFRWFSALTFKLSLKWSKNYLKVYVVEKYWKQRLVDWKSSRVPINIGGRKRKRLVHDVWNLILNFLIGFQVIIVVVCKTLRLIPIFLVIMVVYFWHLCKWLKHNLLIGKLSSSNNSKGSESEQPAVSTKSDLSPYVLQLQDEVELASRTLRSISKAVNRLIHKAEKQQAKNLMKLLDKSTGFQGVAEFDNDQVPALQSQEQVSNCWSLVVVTLTSIAFALPHVRKDMVDLLLRGVSEGLSYVTNVEETLFDNKGDLVHITKAASNVWLNVELYKKWLDNDLQEQAQQGKTSTEILKWLGDIAKNIVTKLEKSKKRGLEDNTRQKLIAANSMYRISQTLLLDYQCKGYNTNETLFEKLSVMIADILGACLTNLPHVITTKCYADPIETREESVRLAARILGQTKDIMEILQRLKVPNLNPDQMANIDSWRDIVKHQNPTNLVTSSSNNEFVSSSSIELLKITVK